MKSPGCSRDYGNVIHLWKSFFPSCACSRQMLTHTKRGMKPNVFCSDSFCSDCFFFHFAIDKVISSQAQLVSARPVFKCEQWIVSVLTAWRVHKLLGRITHKVQIPVQLGNYSQSPNRWGVIRALPYPTARWYIPDFLSGDGSIILTKELSLATKPSPGLPKRAGFEENQKNGQNIPAAQPKITICMLSRKLNNEGILWHWAKSVVWKIRRKASLINCFFAPFVLFAVEDDMPVIVRTCSTQNMGHNCGFFSLEKVKYKGCLTTCTILGCNAASSMRCGLPLSLLMPVTWVLAVQVYRTRWYTTVKVYLAGKTMYWINEVLPIVFTHERRNPCVCDLNKTAKILDESLIDLFPIFWWTLRKTKCYFVPLGVSQCTSEKNYTWNEKLSFGRQVKKLPLCVLPVCDPQELGNLF